MIQNAIKHIYKMVMGKCYTLGINCENNYCDMEVIYMISKKTNNYVVRSRTNLDSGQIELKIKIRIKDEITSFVKELYSIKGIYNVVY